MNPIIGITAQQRIIETSGGEELAHVVNDVYTNAVIRSGGTPMLLSPVASSEVARLLDLVDGLLLSGGGDVDPRFYGGKAHADMYEMYPDRDEFEIVLAQEAQRRHTPLLAICRGLQILNVALGGSLIEDIPSEIGSDNHAIRGPRVINCHQTVSIEADCLVANVIGSLEVCVNSIHHQAVREVAPSLRAAGWAADGVVEVLDPVDQSWPLLAVQWHPEYLSVNDDPTSLALFQAFVDSARSAA